VLRALEPAAALRHLLSQEISVALVDMRLGTGSGLDLIAELRRRQQELVCILMTAYASTRTAIQALQEGVHDFIAKPFTIDDLIDLLARGFERADLIQRRSIAEHALRASEERYRELYDNNPAMFITLQPDGKLVSINRFGADQLGYLVPQVLGKHIHDLVAECSPSIVADAIGACLLQPGSVRCWNAALRRKDDSTVWMRMSARAMRHARDGDSLLIVCEDITEAHELARRLSIEASHDSLTGLINRREMERRLERALQTARQDCVEHALCYLDLDQFKVINDVCGHMGGDELLRQLGKALPLEVRHRDTLARLGGDEFALLMEHCSMAQGRRVAQALLQRVEDFRFIWGDKSFRIGVSIGLVPIHAESESVTAVLGAADAACYAAKDKGRNRVHEYHADDLELARRRSEMQWVAHLGEALEADRLFLCFQPIIAVAGDDHGVERFELLLRMRAPSGEIIAPAAFMSAAERFGMSSRIDRWVFRNALQRLAARRAHLDRLELCFINLSACTLGEESFVDFVRQELEASPLAPTQICFEITETAAIANLGLAASFMGALQTMGCRFALDDFGSGLSSFAYLKTLPVDFLKLDGSFVKDIVDDPIDLAMVKAMNEIGQVMNKRTIAEFVENDLILAKLRTLGVDYAQGFAIAPPRPLDELPD
jgi:diguanylate cyclase (GGDEF)-like protein/PAS domain S-box-containing protein